MVGQQLGLLSQVTALSAAASSNTLLAPPPYTSAPMGTSDAFSNVITLGITQVAEGVWARQAQTARVTAVPVEDVPLEETVVDTPVG